MTNKDKITLNRVPATKSYALPYLCLEDTDIDGKFAVIDIETTGLDSQRDEIIELGICIAEYSNYYGVVNITEFWSLLEQPSKAISPEITKITGITDEHVAGCRIDDQFVSDALSGVDFIIAHNASFDRKFFDKRFPHLANLKWSCSMTETDWRSRGYETKALRYLLMDNGFFFDGHRAGIDAIATAWLMRCDWDAFRDVKDSAFRDNYTVRVIGNSFAIKDELKGVGMSFTDCKVNGKHWFISGLGLVEREEIIGYVKSLGHTNIKYEVVTPFERYK